MKRLYSKRRVVETVKTLFCVINVSAPTVFLYGTVSPNIDLCCFKVNHQRLVWSWSWVVARKVGKVGVKGMILRLMNVAVCNHRPRVNYAYLSASNARASFVEVPEKNWGKNAHLARARVMVK